MRKAATVEVGEECIEGGSLRAVGGGADSDGDGGLGNANVAGGSKDVLEQSFGFSRHGHVRSEDGRKFCLGVLRHAQESVYEQLVLPRVLLELPLKVGLFDWHLLPRLAAGFEDVALTRAVFRKRS